MDLPSYFADGLAVAAWSEKIPGKGEDAPPFIEMYDNSKVIVGAVFDGLGGAGSATWELDGVVQTGATLASILGRDVLRDYLKTIEDRATGHPQSLTELIEIHLTKDHLSEEYDREFARVSETFQTQQQSKLKSRMLRMLPTTMAAFAIFHRDTSTNIRILWSGDSRLYFLSKDGLHLLSRDHVKIRPGDTEPGGGDAPLLHFISEVSPNFIDQRDIETAKVGFVVAATDGAYAYFASAVHFECALWRAVFSYQHPFDLDTEISSVANDDSSLVMMAVNAKTRDELHAALTEMKPRYRDISLRISDSERRRSRISQYSAEIARLNKEISDLLSDSIEPPASVDPKSTEA